MGAIWRRAEGAGIDALKAGDSAAAEAARELHKDHCGKCGGKMKIEVFKGVEIDVCPPFLFSPAAARMGCTTSAATARAGTSWSRGRRTVGAEYKTVGTVSLG